MTESAADRPLISVITPMYNVESYLSDFFESLETQPGNELLEVVLVDDGSTDGTGNRAEEFAAHTMLKVKCVRKENGGQASARNVGLEHATGNWVTFPDPDDVLSPGYFNEVIGFLGDDIESPVSMVTSRMVLWWEDTGRITPHALDHRFNSGTRLVQLNSEPNCVQAHVTTGFFRLDIIRRNELRFREDLRYRFEDGNFVSKYLLAFEQPTVAMCATASYFYRQRADHSSTIQSSKSNTEKYEAPLRYGYLDVFEAAQLRRGRAPEWLQNLVLYDQFWVIRSSQAKGLRQITWPVGFAERLKELLRTALSFIDDELIMTSELVTVAPWMRLAFLLFKHGDSHSQPQLQHPDRRRGLLQLTYIFSGEQPTEELVTRKGEIRARFEKTYQLEYVGAPIAFLRTLWVAWDDEFSLRLNGAVEAIIPLGSQPATTRVTRGEIESVHLKVPAERRSLPQPKLPEQYKKPDAANLEASSAKRMSKSMSGKSFRARIARARARGVTTTARLLRDRREFHRALHSADLAKEFREAWLLMDRDSDANDSAEDLYRWIRDNRPKVNVWFVIRRDSSDWERLAGDGFRLIEYGSATHAAALTHANHVASSHADRFVSHPFQEVTLKTKYTFTFLQHGVIKGDISTWLNAKSITTFITSTQAEYEYVSGPGPFKFSRREVRLAGLPRFDTLLRHADRIPDEARKTILVMPTWRDYLVGEMKETSRDRDVAADFAATNYARSWMEYLQSERLHDMVTREGYDLVFMPHPNMSMYLSEFVFSPGVKVLSYSDVDVREMFARAALLVTDYSSTAFNMAFLQKPVVYFQFDQERYYIEHTERPGYFSYDNDGFGPVAVTASEAVDATAVVLSGAEDVVYAHRRADAFPVRDGRNSERTFNAMVESRRCVSKSELGLPAPADDWYSLVSSQ